MSEIAVGGLVVLTTGLFVWLISRPLATWPAVPTRTSCRARTMRLSGGDRRSGFVGSPLPSYCSASDS